MARKPTTFSKVSTGYKDSARSIAENAYDLGFINGYGTDLTLGDDLTITGTGTFTGGVTIDGADILTDLNVTTSTVDFGSLGVSGGTSTVTVALSGATKTGKYYFVSAPSGWYATYPTVSLGVSSGDTTGELNLTATNSGLTAVDPASSTFAILELGITSV